MTKGQRSQQMVSKYGVVWQKLRKDWKLATDIWETELKPLLQKKKSSVPLL
jgi:hypothetical protein